MQSITFLVGCHSAERNRDQPSITRGLGLKETFWRTQWRNIFISRGGPDRDEVSLHLACRTSALPGANRTSKHGPSSLCQLPNFKGWLHPDV